MEQQSPSPSACASSTDQAAISQAQYGPCLGTQLPPSDYKLSCHLPNGRSAFTFCVCPGGQVVAAGLRRRGSW